MSVASNESETVICAAPPRTTTATWPLRLRDATSRVHGILSALRLSRSPSSRSPADAAGPSAAATEVPTRSTDPSVTNKAMGTGFTGISGWILSIRLDPVHPVIRLMRRAGRFRLTEAAEIGSLSVKFAHPAPAPLNVVGESSTRKRSLKIA